MTPERWQQVKALFDQALEREPSEQQAFLAGACGGDVDLRREVTALLGALEDAGSRFEKPAVQTDPMIGRQFGAYRVLRRLGSGGMGAVYLAARADDQFRRLAAVKAIRPELLDAQTKRRFENERHTLAALEHPNIVRLLDGGETMDGIPFLVMDYVEGQPIDKFCADRSLSVRERLALFRTLCAAVHYAHQNLVVHRDLKPANILVTPEGVPKLLDFGIAKLLRPEYAAGAVGMTRTAAQPMTPEFASPEQILGRPITTASDIYSLGVLLFHLLTGKHPFEGQSKSAFELERAICEAQASKPSEAASLDLARQLRGDLDTIVLCAMRKEPQKRYASAQHLAQDVRRYLEGEAVAARGDSVAYKVGKFVTRNLAAVTGTGLALALLAGLAISDHTNRLRAEQKFNDLRDLANWMINSLDGAIREGPTPAREAAASKAEAYLDGLRRESKGDRSLELEVVKGYLKVAQIRGSLFVANLGDQAAAREVADKALALAKELEQTQPANPEYRLALAMSHERLGDVAGDGAPAIAEYRRALEFVQPKTRDEARIWSKIARQEGDLDPAAAMRAYRGTEIAAQAWVDSDPNDADARRMLAFAKENAGWFGLMAGLPADAEKSVKDAIAIYEETAGPKPSALAKRNLAMAYKRLAEIQKRAGQTAEALANCRRAFAATESLRAEDPKVTLYAIDSAQERVLLIDLLLATGDKAAARTETAEAVAFLKPLALAGKPNAFFLVDYVTILVGTPFSEFGTPGDSLAMARKAAALMQNKDPETLDLLAKAYARVRKPSDAIDAEMKAISFLPPLKPGPVPEVRQKLEAQLHTLQTAAAPH